MEIIAYLQVLRNVVTSSGKSLSKCASIYLFGQRYFCLYLQEWTKFMKEEKKGKWYKKKTIWFFCIGIILIFLMPLILTQGAFYSIFNFSETGPIGDTIGGITAPFIGLLGATLVYISFEEQRKANKIQIDFLLFTANKERLMIESDEIPKLFNSFSFSNKDKVGIDALKPFIANLHNLDNQSIHIRNHIHDNIYNYAQKFSSFLLLISAHINTLNKLTNVKENNDEQQSYVNYYIIKLHIFIKEISLSYHIDNIIGSFSSDNEFKNKLHYLLNACNNYKDSMNQFYHFNLIKD